MPAYREEKLKSVLMAYAAEFIAREASQRSIITVTDVELSEDLSQATIRCTIFPVEHEERALEFLRRQRSDLYHFVNAKMKSKRIPLFDFAIDEGEKSRQQLDKAFLADKLRREENDWPGGQVVRRSSAKALYGSSILPQVSN